jgi:hypothetical protein
VSVEGEGGPLLQEELLYDAEQDVAHGGRIPLCAALRGRHLRLVEVGRDLAERVAAGALTLDPAHHRLRECRRRPSRTPLARLTASASRCALRDQRRSNWAKVASMFAIASPVGVEVSTAQSSATSA